jgi:acetyl esterase/lipase
MLESSRVNLRNSQTSDPEQVLARNGYVRGLRRLSPVGPPMQEWLLAHDPVAAARQSQEEFERSQVAAANPMRRPESRRAFDRWRAALTGEHRASGWLGEREGYAEFVRSVTGAADGGRPGVRVDCGGAPALRVGRPDRADAPVVLHLHGGGYVMGSADQSAPLARRLADSVGGWALVPDYRLAPEHPFPAQLEDGMTVYRWLLDQGIPAARIATAGDSAGGNLATTIALKAHADGIPAPGGVVAFSPWYDMEHKGKTLATNAATDELVQLPILRNMSAMFLGDQGSPADPLANPLHADLASLPPIYLTVSDHEALQDDSERLADKARNAGVDVTFRIEPGQQHVHTFMAGRSPEADAVIAEAGAWLRKTLS